MSCNNDTCPEIIGKSFAVNSIKKFVEKAALSSLPVLVEGPSGTGKELVANAIHKLGHRAAGAFIAVNCGAMPKELLENELFGHEAGAFTGATTLKRGLFELADNGTLFIDEIGEMERESQAKLLRVIETGVVRRLGAVKEFKVDVRIIAATNRVLEEQVEKGRFRSDLYYRLSVLSTFLCPLKERKEDIFMLSTHYMKKICEKEKIQEKKLSVEAMAALCGYDWPGNIRELINVLSRMAIMLPENVISFEDLPEKITNKTGRPKDTDIKDLSLDEFVRMSEKQFITVVLERNAYDKEKTAEMLKISRAKLYRKLKELGINKG